MDFLARSTPDTGLDFERGYPHQKLKETTLPAVAYISTLYVDGRVTTQVVTQQFVQTKLNKKCCGTRIRPHSRKGSADSTYSPLYAYLLKALRTSVQST